MANTINLTHDEQIESLRKYFEVPYEQQLHPSDLRVSDFRKYFHCGSDFARSTMGRIAEAEPDDWELLTVRHRGTDYLVLRPKK